MAFSIRAGGGRALTLGACLGLWAGWARTVSAEVIDLSLAPEEVGQGQTFSFLVKLTDNTIPLYMYTLDVNISAPPEFEGTVTGLVQGDDPFLYSNLHLIDNLIEAGPTNGDLHPISKVKPGSISPGGHRGLSPCAPASLGIFPPDRAYKTHYQY